MARETTTSASKQGQNCGEMGSFDQAGKPRPRRQAVPLPYLRTCIGAPEKAGWRGSSRTACLETGGVSQAAGPGCVRPGCGTRLRPCIISRKTPTRRAGAWEDWAREGRGSAGVCSHRVADACGAHHGGVMHGAERNLSQWAARVRQSQWEDANNIQKLEYRSLSSIIKTTERALNRCSLLPGRARRAAALAT